MTLSNPLNEERMEEREEHSIDLSEFAKGENCFDV